MNKSMNTRSICFALATWPSTLTALAADPPKPAVKPAAPELYDQATHLQKMGQRWYDPLEERWISQDLIYPTAGANPYKHCNNSPTNGTDPTGSSFWASF